MSRYSYGSLNPILEDPDQDELPEGSFSDHAEMFEYIKHQAIKKRGFRGDPYKGMKRFRAIVLTQPPQNVTDWLKSKVQELIAIPKASFGFKIRIPELHASLEDPCQMDIDLSTTPAVELPENVRRVIQQHPWCAPKASGWGKGDTTMLPVPKVGDVIWVEFEKGPNGGRLQNPIYVDECRGVSAGLPAAACKELAAAMPDLFKDQREAVLLNRNGQPVTYDDPQGYSWSNGAKQRKVIWQSTQYMTHLNGVELKNGMIENSGLLISDSRAGITQRAKLVSPAMDDFMKLAAAFEKKFGMVLQGSGYRTYQGQVDQRMRRVEGDVNCNTGNGEGSGYKDKNCNSIGPAATPGTSNHGWGAAVDLDRTNWELGSMSSALWKKASESKHFQWLNKYAGDYNFTFGASTENWHIDWMLFADNVTGETFTSPSEPWSGFRNKYGHGTSDPDNLITKE